MKFLLCCSPYTHNSNTCTQQTHDKKMHTTIMMNINRCMLIFDDDTAYPVTSFSFFYLISFIYLFLVIFIYFFLTFIGRVCFKYNNMLLFFSPFSFLSLCYFLYGTFLILCDKIVCIEKQF